MLKVARVALPLTLVLAIMLVQVNIAVASGPAASVAPNKATLAIKAPETALVGETVEIRVYESASGKPVAKAAVWALESVLAPATNATADDYAKAAAKAGLNLGATDEAGLLKASFKQAGAYYLVASRDGYATGLAKISIQGPGLSIRAPSVAYLAQVVSITVLRNGQPAGGVAVWALLAQNVTSSSASSLNALTVQQGFLIGTTDKTGLVKCRFLKAGEYALVAKADDGTVSTRISIKPWPTSSSKLGPSAVSPSNAAPAPVPTSKAVTK